MFNKSDLFFFIHVELASFTYADPYMDVVPCNYIFISVIWIQVKLKLTNFSCHYGVPSLHITKFIKLLFL